MRAWGAPRMLPALALALLLLPSAGGWGAGAAGPVERVAVDLILVDVEALDAHGRPLRGLKAADFEVRLDGVVRTLYSVDDRCGCREGGDVQIAAGSSRPDSPEGGAVAPQSATAARQDPEIFVFYLDFSLMDPGGRNRAIAEVGRWIRETMRPGDQVMLVGSTFAKGAFVVADLSSDRALLQAALGRMKEDRGLVDPHVGFNVARKLECDREWKEDNGRFNMMPRCNANAHEEYRHTRAALRTLARFSERLGALPQRKHIVFISEVVPFDPRELYPLTRSIGNQRTVVEDAGASAVAARAVIHAMTVGAAGTVTESLAEQTGGTFNRNISDLSRTLDAARNRCECLYRLGIEPDPKDGGRNHTLTVRAGQRMISNLKLRTYGAADRWMIKARGVLEHPDAAKDLPVTAALIPVEATGGRWSATVEVGLHAAELTRLPGSDGVRAEWEAGALLVHEDSGKTWEFLAVSSLTASSRESQTEWMLHQRELTDLPPGRYRLAAFVRDRTVELFGGASAQVELPDLTHAAIVGPILRLSQRRALLADLPLQPPSTAAVSTRARSLSTADVPPGDLLSREAARAPFRIDSWLCGAGQDPAGLGALERRLTFEDKIVWSFTKDQAVWSPAGDCRRLTDHVEAGLLDEAPYSYHLQWTPAPEGVPLAQEVELP